METTKQLDTLVHAHLALMALVTLVTLGLWYVVIDMMIADLVN